MCRAAASPQRGRNSYSVALEPIRELFSSLTMWGEKGAAKSVESPETQNIIFVISEAIDFTGVIIIAFGAVIGVVLCARDLIR